MKPTDAELRQLAADAFQLKGWEHLSVFAKAAIKNLRGWRIPVTSKTGKRIFVRYPRVEMSLNPKFGELRACLMPKLADVEKLKKRLDPAAFDEFRSTFREMLSGVGHTLTAISTVTCQATGRPGARQIAEQGGWIRTLHPTVARKLKVKEKPLRSWNL